jgi:ligand-binding sensor domain-containing protein/serine phosphatase RsbU (regulator of sigma subunit)
LAFLFIFDFDLMRRFFKILISFGLLLSSELAFAQIYNFKNYNTEHGLSQSQVLSIYQDKKGYMWFGTNSGGVSKYDGNKFYTYNTNQGLVNDIVFSITETHKNELAFGTAKGISIYNHINFKTYNEKNGLKNSFVFKLLRDKDQLWIGTQGGVYVLKNDTIVAFNGDSLLNESSVWTMFLDKKNNIWFGTYGNGVIHYDRVKNKFTHFTAKEGLTENTVFSIGEKKNGDILVGTQYGLNIINSKLEVRQIHELPNNNNVSISCILNDGNDQFYLGSHSSGVSKFDFQKNNVIVKFDLTNGLANNPIVCSFKDRDGNLWLGSNGSGLFKYHSNKFVYYTKSSGFKENYVNTVSEDLQGNIWVASRNSGLVKIAGKELEFFTFKNNVANSIPDNNTNAILPLKDGRILFGTEDGLCVLDNNKLKTYSTDNFRHKFIISLFQDSKQGIWIGTNDGLFKLSGEDRFTEIIISTKNIASQLAILFIMEDKNGKIWIGTEVGLICIDSGKTTIFNKENKFLSSRINNGVFDSKGNMWLGTEEGLFHYDSKTFKKISADYNLPSTYINFIQLHKNHLFIGSNNGIDIIPLADFYAGIKKNRHLGKDDGLLNLESNSNASAIDSKGRLLVGTVSGLQIYNPALDLPNKNEALLNITEVKLFYGQEDVFNYSDKNNTNSILPQNLTLPFSKNNLTFKYVGISLIAPEKVMYRYKLQGLDEDWTPEVSKTEVTYSSLPPGTYTFMVKAMNNDGIWNQKEATYSFTILPPWYKTWWFYTLCVIVLFSGIFAYNTIKTKKLVADKQKLEKQVDERTKELREEKEKVEVINKEVIEQKALIENKNIEITDSIKYAKNIQEALLPPLADTENAFDNCFILYLPKDIVSGDFFWYSEHNNKQYIAAADCTGHGVPGAFMSIVGNNLLKEIINQKNISNPGEILFELHQGVKIALNQNNHENERRDGMDIALCVYDKEKGVIEYAGANRPLWIYRKEKAYELEITKASKYPIGGLELEEKREYTSHSIPVNSGDTIYIFSDGFADQFGGPRGKKYMVSNMQKLLLDNIQLPMPEQKKNVAASFRNWKDDLEQIDDVLVIGIRF